MARTDDDVTRLIASSDQWDGELSVLVDSVRTHAPFCEYPAPLCPGEGVWDYLDHLSSDNKTLLLVLALYRLADHEETTTEET